MSETIVSRMFERYVRRQAARSFAAVHWRFDGAAERWRRNVPTLFVANHSNWWDGGLAFLVSRALGLRFRILMEERQLARYRFFLRVGARPLRREPPRAAWADLHAAGAELRGDTGLWIFPQGERRPPGERPLRCERGAARLVGAVSGPLRVCSVAFRYAFLGEQRPEAFALVGEEWIPSPAERLASRRALMERISARLEDTLGTLDGLVAHERLETFRPLTAGGLSINKRLDRFRHAVGLLRGPFEARNG
jgi:Acyltransferase